MGAESSSLNECSLDSPIVSGSESESESCVEIRQGVILENDAEITVFTEKSKKRQNCLWFERNVKFLKSVRHPNILHYIKDGKAETKYVVTERATPLSLVIEDLSPVEIVSGICNVISALSFLHDKVKVCHNNVCVDAIYVTTNGQWKLGGYECSCRFTDVSTNFLKSISPIRNESCITPEEDTEDGIDATPEWGHTRDVYSFGVMVDSLVEQLDELDDLLKTFELRIQDECLNKDPSKRPKLHTFLEDKIFSNDLLYLTTFLHHITLKSKEETETFYRTLVPRLHSLPEKTVGKHLVQSLLCRFVLLNKTARECVAPHILTPKSESNSNINSKEGEIIPLFSEDVFKKYVVPELYKAFCCHEINIRTLLLQYFPHYAYLFDAEELEDVIFPQILLGLRDTNEELAALSLHCLADMVPLLGRDKVIGGQSKTYFIEGSPKNVNGGVQLNIQETIKNVNGVIGKVRLKDLATLSKPINEISHNSVSDGKSREERMREAREKREQRKLERQNKKNLAMKASPEKKESVDATTHSPVSKTSNITTSQQINETINNDISHGSSKPIDDWSAENSERKEVDLEPEVFSKDTDDWSDWEEENRTINDDWSDLSHDKRYSTDSVELNSHSSTGLHTPNRHNSTDFDPKSWSIDSQVLETKQSEIQNKSSHNTKLPSTVKKSGMSLKGKAKTIKPKSDQPLGAEFDIHSIEIRVKAEAEKEIDFFADMMPEIKTSMRNENSDDFVHPKSPGNAKQPADLSKLSFSYLETGGEKDTSSSGWDDGGWDAEGF